MINMFLNRVILSVFLICGVSITQLYAKAAKVSQSAAMESFFVLDSIQKITFSLGKMTIEDKQSIHHDFSITSSLRIVFLDSIPDSSAIDTSQHPVHIMAHANPIEGGLEIVFHNNENAFRLVEILTMDGKILQTAKTTQSTSVSLDLHGLGAGVYVCKITNGHQIQSIRFLKK